MIIFTNKVSEMIQLANKISFKAYLNKVKPDLGCPGNKQDVNNHINLSTFDIFNHYSLFHANKTVIHLNSK